MLRLKIHQWELDGAGKLSTHMLHARGFTAASCKKKDAEYGLGTDLDVSMSEEQAEELCKWLCEKLYGIVIRKAE